MTSHEIKPSGTVPETATTNHDVGLREITRSIIDDQKRNQMIQEHSVELHRSFDGPQMTLNVHGISAVEFLRKVESVIPDIRERDPMVKLVLDNPTVNRELAETIERRTISAVIGHTPEEWGAVRDAKLAEGIASFRDLAIISGARYLVEPDSLPDARPYTRADKWLAELKS